MGLNIVSSGGKFDPWVKFNSKAGRWFVKGADDQEQEVSPTLFVADFANIKTGWMKFVAGIAPDRVWDESITSAAPRPSADHKRGFLLRLFSQTAFGGVVELSSTSMHICNAINALYDAYEAGLGANPGKLPVVKFVRAVPMKDKHGTNYAPEFVIEKWTPRPAAFDDGASEESAPVAAPSPSAPPPPPPPKGSVSEF